MASERVKLVKNEKDSSGNVTKEYHIEHGSEESRAMVG